MEFLKFIRYLEELLYEVMTWLLFYPRTMWRTIRQPLAVAHQTATEMAQPADRQFLDLLSPPLFLMLTLLLAHALEIALHQAVPAPTSAIGRILLASETNLLAFRAISWSFFPLLMALTLLLRERRPIDRETLRRPFFIQCLFVAPLIVGAAIATALGHLGHLGAAAWVGAASVAWYLAAQTRWFRSSLLIGTGRALALSVSTFLAAVAVDITLVLAILGIGT